MSDELVKRLQLWEEVFPQDMDKEDGHLYQEAADRIYALTAERDGLRGAMDYILDGMGIAEPDYDIDPDDDFLDAANSDWVRDTLTRLAAALKGGGHE